MPTANVGSIQNKLIQGQPQTTHFDLTQLDNTMAPRPETMFAWRKHKGNPEPVCVQFMTIKG